MAGPAIDNNGARCKYRMMRHWTAYGWYKAGDRDVLGYTELLRARLVGKWEVLHACRWARLKSAKRERTGPCFEERGNVAIDTGM